MMRILLAVFFVLLGVGLEAKAAAPSLSCSYSTTGGSTSPAPLGVVVDCSATTDADTAKPFHDLFYVHTFGDPSAGLWTNGANTAQSKNFATGPIAAHVYETPGTYTITTTVTDGTNIARTTQSITVSDPDTTYSGTATVCFFNSAVGTGCPSGATQTSSSDWDAAIGSCMGTTKRCLFKRGDTFTASAASNVSAAGPNTIGAYGSGALPIVNLNTNINGIAFNNVAVNDSRLMDINFVGDTTGTGSAVVFSANVSGVTVLRVTSSNTGGYGVVGTGTAKITNSVVQDGNFSANYSGSGIHARIETSALLGNAFGPVGGGTAEFSARIQRAQKSVIAHNIFGAAAAGKLPLTMRADTHSTTADDSFYNVIADNKFAPGAADGSGVTVETNGGVDARSYDVILERNWVVLGAYTGASNRAGIGVFSCSTCSLRNNLIDLSAPTTANRFGIEFKANAGDPAPVGNNVYNNTFYSSATATTNAVKIQAAAVTDTTIKNNVAWFDNGTSFLSNAGTNTVASNNSSDGQTTGTDPAFDNVSGGPIGFRTSTSSYAASGGTSVFPPTSDDFLNCDDTTANVHMGAFVPRTRATCRGAAGP